MTINYKRQFLNIVETYGEQEHEKVHPNRADLIINTKLLLQRPKGPLVKKLKKNSFQMLVPTFVIGLSPEEHEIFHNIHKKTRNGIKRSLERDNLSYSEHYYPKDEQLINFSLRYNTFAKEKKIDKCLLKKLIALRDKHSLLLTEIFDSQNNLLCSHTLLLDRNTSQAYGLYSFADRFSFSDKALIGRANKFLHWKEIQSLKQKGYMWLNLGGIVAGKQGEGVNHFKLELGAARAYDLKIYHSNTLIGKLCTILLYFKWKNYLTFDEQEQILQVGKHSHI